jgi:serine/threonine-protein kinase RsbW
LRTSRQEGTPPESEEDKMIRIDIPADLQYLNVVGEAIRALLRGEVELENAGEFIHGVELAVHEACTNIIKHAYAGQSGRIEIVMAIGGDPQRVMVETFDSGRSFDLESVKAPDLDAVQERGYGIFLMRQLMDEVTYRANSQRNRWQLVKHIA